MLNFSRSIKSFFKPIFNYVNLDQYLEIGILIRIHKLAEYGTDLIWIRILNVAVSNAICWYTVAPLNVLLNEATTIEKFVLAERLQSFFCRTLDQQNLKNWSV